jgi:hemerythrin-like domain-containing protein
MTETRRPRRALLVLGASALLLGGCGKNQAHAAEAKETGVKATSATEDLMREHGVLRRALLVYRESAGKLRRNPREVAPAALNQAARLFRSFGEDYHERKLEEAYIFPAVRRLSGPAAAYPDVLQAQHDRGREITGYIISATGKGVIGEGEAEKLARAMESFVLMYENHAAREDTIVFPAWKESLSGRQFKEMGERFETIERQQFGRDGFADAVQRIGRIEAELGFANLAQFTAPPPARA